MFIGAVVQHRALAPAKRSLGGLLAAKRWHAHLGEYEGGDAPLVLVVSAVAASALVGCAVF